MTVTVVLIVRLHNLFAVVMLSGIYSLLAASMFVVFDAVDVAFTEAAVGAGISTVLLLGALSLTTREEKDTGGVSVLPLLIVLMVGSALIYGTLDMPLYGDPTAPIHQHVAPYYLENGIVETSVPNVVTAILASYRGFDTLGEVFVVFTAGIGVIMLLNRGQITRRHRSRRDET
jgi:multicomponent Na+:H+ antiporter subunit B